MSDAVPPSVEPAAPVVDAAPVVAEPAPAVPAVPAEAVPVAAPTESAIPLVETPAVVAAQPAPVSTDATVVPAEPVPVVPAESAPAPASDPNPVAPAEKPAETSNPPSESVASSEPTVPASDIVTNPEANTANPVSNPDANPDAAPVNAEAVPAAGSAVPAPNTDNPVASDVAAAPAENVTAPASETHGDSTTQPESVVPAVNDTSAAPQLDLPAVTTTVESEVPVTSSAQATPAPRATARLRYPQIVPLAQPEVLYDDAQQSIERDEGKRRDIGCQTVLLGRHLILGPLGVAAAVAEEDVPITDSFHSVAPAVDGTLVAADDMRDFLLLYRPALRLIFATYARGAHPLPPLTAMAFPSFVSGSNNDSLGGGDVDAMQFSAEQRRAERVWWGNTLLRGEPAVQTAAEGQESTTSVKCAIISAAEFLQMSSELGLVPGIVTKREAMEHFRATCAQEQYESLTYAAFVECIVRIASIRYAARSMASAQALAQPGFSTRDKTSLLFVALGLNDIEVLYHKLSHAFDPNTPAPNSDDCISAADWRNVASYLTVATETDPEYDEQPTEPPVEFMMNVDALDTEVEDLFRDRAEPPPNSIAYAASAAAQEAKRSKGGNKAMRRTKPGTATPTGSAEVSQDEEMVEQQEMQQQQSPMPRSNSRALGGESGESDIARVKREQLESEIRMSMQLISEHWQPTASPQPPNKLRQSVASSTTPYESNNSNNYTFSASPFMPKTSSAPAQYTTFDSQVMTPQPQQQRVSHYGQGYTGGINTEIPARRMREAPSYATMYGLDQPMLIPQFGNQQNLHAPPPQPIPGSQFHFPIVGSALGGYIHDSAPLPSHFSHQPQQHQQPAPQAPAPPPPAPAGKQQTGVSPSAPKGSKSSKDIMSPKPLAKPPISPRVIAGNAKSKAAPAAQATSPASKKPVTKDAPKDSKKPTDMSPTNKSARTEKKAPEPPKPSPAQGTSTTRAAAGQKGPIKKAGLQSPSYESIYPDGEEFEQKRAPHTFVSSPASVPHNYGFQQQQQQQQYDQSYEPASMGIYSGGQFSTPSFSPYGNQQPSSFMLNPSSADPYNNGGMSPQYPHSGLMSGHGNRPEFYGASPYDGFSEHEAKTLNLMQRRQDNQMRHVPSYQ